MRDRGGRGREVTGRMSPMNLARGEAGGSARSGHRPETPMAVFSRPARGASSTIVRGLNARSFGPSSPARTGGRQDVEDGGQALPVGESAVALDDGRGVLGMAGLEQPVQPAQPV